MLTAQIISASDLDRGREIFQTCAEIVLALTDIVSKRAGHRVLQQPLVGLKALLIDSNYLRTVPIQRHHAHKYQDGQNRIKNRYTRRYKLAQIHILIKEDASDCTLIHTVFALQNLAGVT